MGPRGRMSCRRGRGAGRARPALTPDQACSVLTHPYPAQPPSPHPAHNGSLLVAPHELTLKFKITGKYDRSHKADAANAAWAGSDAICADEGWAQAHPPPHPRLTQTQETTEEIRATSFPMLLRSTATADSFGCRALKRVPVWGLWSVQKEPGVGEGGGARMRPPAMRW